jgi:prepilin-type N-terminal cleavage/methylation domain-containing protein
LKSTSRLERSDRGFTLIESLVTMVIVGIAFVVFVGGMGTAIIASDVHRKEAVSDAAVRNLAEAVKASDYVDCATPDAYGSSAASPFTGTNAFVAPSVHSLDSGAQLLTFFAVAASTSFTAPAGMTKQYDDASSGSSNAVTAAMADQPLADAGATGTRPATALASGDGAAQAFAFDGFHGAGGIQLHGVAHGHSTTTTLALPAPVGATNGDVLIAQIVVRDPTTTVTPPTGWTLLKATAVGASLKSLIYQGSLASRTSLRWTLSAAKESAGGVAAYTGFSAYTTAVTKVLYWNGSTFPDPPTTCTTDQGLQLVHLHISTADRRGLADVDLVKRKP